MEELNKIMSLNFINYKGCLIKKTDNGKWEALGETFDTIDQAKNCITEEIKKFARSLAV
jgi:hypothetical protein